MRAGERKGPMLNCAECGVQFYAPPCNKRLYCSVDCRYEAKKFTADRFWARVDKRGPDECWPWLAAKDKDGYGRCSDNVRERRAHVVALELTLGRPIGEGLGGLHSCDNPPCCNPGHLREGTPKDNTQDRILRNRLTVPYRDYAVADHRRPTGDRNGTHTHPESIARGSRAGMHTAGLCKLTEDDVRTIRRAYKAGETLSDLGRKYGVGAPQIHRIVNRQRWAWVTDEGDQK